MKLYNKYNIIRFIIMSSIVNNTTKCYVTNDSNYDNIEETFIIKKKIKNKKVLTLKQNILKISV